MRLPPAARARARLPGPAHPGPRGAAAPPDAPLAYGGPPLDERAYLGREVGLELCVAHGQVLQQVAREGADVGLVHEAASKHRVRRAGRGRGGGRLPGWRAGQVGGVGWGGCRGRWWWWAGVWSGTFSRFPMLLEVVTRSARYRTGMRVQAPLPSRVTSLTSRPRRGGRGRGRGWVRTCIPAPARGGGWRRPRRARTRRSSRGGAGRPAASESVTRW